MERLTRNTFNPNVMGGRPCIRGMRVTEGMILELIAAGYTTARILEAYPYLESDDIQQALLYAAALEEGALITIDEGRHKVRLLPIKK